MSVHFGYAAVHYLWKGLGRRRSGKYGELGSKAETEGLVGGGEEDDTQLRKDEIPVARSLDEDLQWPPRGKFLGNWIMQLSFAPLLCLLRFLGPSSPLGKLSALYVFSLLITHPFPPVLAISFANMKCRDVVVVG